MVLHERAARGTGHRALLATDDGTGRAPDDGAFRLAVVLLGRLIRCALVRGLVFGGGARRSRGKQHCGGRRGNDLPLEARNRHGLALS